MSFWEWVVEYALDGIVAGIVGGGVTGAAVWATLRHERKVREEDRREARVADLRVQVSAMLGLANRGWLADIRLPEDEERDVFDELYVRSKELQARAAPVDTGLHDVMKEFSALLNVVHKKRDSDLRSKLCRDLTIRLETWFADRSMFEFAAAAPWANGKLSTDGLTLTSYLPISGPEDG